MSNARLQMFRIVSCLGFCLALAGGVRVAAQTNAMDGAARAAELSVSNETFRAYVQFEQQLREAQTAIERARRDAENAASQATETLATRLQSIEQAMASQRDAMQSTVKFMLTVLSVFAGVGFVAIVLTAYFQWRTVNRLAEFSTSMTGLRPTGLLADAGEHDNLPPGVVEQTGERLTGAVQRLERRVVELEHSTHPPLNDRPAEKNGAEAPHAALPPATETATTETGSDQALRIKGLLDRGQALLNSDQPDAAVEFIDQALALDPNHTEALVKKGTVLERMRKFPEAIECYDRAIAVDGAMTIAYLYKGGLYNRMERFSEAVECYEQALRTQEKRGV